MSDDCWRCDHCGKLMRSRYHKARHEHECEKEDQE